MESERVSLRDHLQGKDVACWGVPTEQRSVEFG